MKIKMFQYMLPSGRHVYSTFLLHEEIDLALMASGPEEVWMPDTSLIKLTRFLWASIALFLIFLGVTLWLFFGRFGGFKNWWHYVHGINMPDDPAGPAHMADGTPEFFKWLAERRQRDLQENPDFYR
ncbi:uncharacterized protein LOC119660938 [Hermetia illucens]|uniref:uncharacterized protein LOC119660938 n=1 Tax=Hermetia illucens TaxID=343691 RepID=UPI0018CC50A0|nr:uncharacterized protein LOC119660938 [Hermetia illucens]